MSCRQKTQLTFFALSWSPSDLAWHDTLELMCKTLAQCTPHTSHKGSGPKNNHFEVIRHLFIRPCLSYADNRSFTEHSTFIGLWPSFITSCLLQPILIVSWPNLLTIYLVLILCLEFANSLPDPYTVVSCVLPFP